MAESFGSVVPPRWVSTPSLPENFITSMVVVVVVAVVVAAVVVGAE